MPGRTLTPVLSNDAPHRPARIRGKHITLAGLRVTYEGGEAMVIPWRDIQYSSLGNAKPSAEFRRAHPNIPREFQLAIFLGSTLRRLIIRDRAREFAHSGQRVTWRQTSPPFLFALTLLPPFALTLILLALLGFDLRGAVQRLGNLRGTPEQILGAIGVLGALCCFYALTSVHALIAWSYWRGNKGGNPRSVELTATELAVRYKNGSELRFALKDLIGVGHLWLSFRTADRTITRVAFDPYRNAPRHWLPLVIRRLPWHLREQHLRRLAREFGVANLIFCCFAELQVRYANTLIESQPTEIGPHGGPLLVGLCVLLVAELIVWRLRRRPALRRRLWKNLRQGRMGADSGSPA